LYICGGIESNQKKTMATITLTKLYSILEPKIGKIEAEMLTSYIDEKISDEIKSDKVNLATKEDLANTKAEMIKWMFIFWVGQLAAMFGLLYFFIKK